MGKLGTQLFNHVQSLTCLGVPDIINVLTQRKKDEQMMAAAAAAFKKQQQAVAVAAATAAETVHQHPLDSESNSETTATTAAVMVKDSHGQEVELD